MQTTTKPVRDLQQGDFYVWEGPQDRVYTWTVSTVEPTGAFAFGSTSTRILRIRFAHPTSPVKYIDSAEDAPATVLQDPMREHNRTITEAQRLLSTLKDALSHAETSVFTLPTGSHSIPRTYGNRYVDSLRACVLSAEEHLTRVVQAARDAWDAFQQPPLPKHTHVFVPQPQKSIFSPVQACECGAIAGGTY